MGDMRKVNEFCKFSCSISLKTEVCHIKIASIEITSIEKGKLKCSLKNTLRAVLLEKLGRDLFSQGNLQMTLLRKVINHIFAFVRESEENNDTYLPHPAFATGNTGESAKHVANS